MLEIKKPSSITAGDEPAEQPIRQDYAQQITKDVEIVVNL
jgi:hypothetical protein